MKLTFRHRVGRVRDGKLRFEHWKLEVKGNVCVRKVCVMEDVLWGCETLCWNQAVFQAVVDVVVNLQFNLIEALWQTFWRTMPLEQRKSVLLAIFITPHLMVLITISTAFLLTVPLTVISVTAHNPFHFVQLALSRSFSPFV